MKEKGEREMRLAERGLAKRERGGLVGRRLAQREERESSKKGKTPIREKQINNV